MTKVWLSIKLKKSMPYTTIVQAKSAGFPTQAEGVSMTIAQINKLADIYDAVKKDEKIKNPFAIAWVQWKKIYKKVGDKWISMSEILDMRKNAEMTFPINVSDLKFAEVEGKNVSEIQVLQAGIWKHPVYGEIKLTQKELEEFVVNFNDSVRRDIAITEGHAVGEEELPALGWFKQLINKGRDGLWATVEWTSKGMQLLKEKAYKYFSPEFYSNYEDPEDHKTYTNVLVGGALTNRPYFKGLNEIVLSEFTFANKDMEIKDILAKDPSELTDEEVKFLKENEADLSAKDKDKFKDTLAEEGEGEGEDDGEGEKKEEEGEKKEEDEGEGEGEGDGEGEKKEASEKVIVTKGALKHLETKANEGIKAMAILQRKEAQIYSEGIVFSSTNQDGVILPKSQDKLVSFLLSLNEKQQKSFKEIMGEIPTGNLFSEQGKNFNAGEEKASDKVQVLASEKMKTDTSLEYRQAVEQVLSENPNLQEEAGNE